MIIFMALYRFLTGSWSGIGDSTLVWSHALKCNVYVTNSQPTTISMNILFMWGPYT